MTDLLYDIEDFENVERLRQSRSTQFSGSSQVDIMGRTLLVSASNLELVKEEIENTEEYGSLVQDAQKFQHTLFHSAIHGLFSLYWSTKYHAYNSGYRDVRYLFEAYLIMRGLNDRKDQAAQLWKTHRIEAETIVGGIEENPLFEFESIDELGKIRDSERDKLYNQYPSFRDVMNYLSERAAHPLRIDGSYLEGEETGGQQFEQLWLSLALLYGFLKEYEITFEGTELEDTISGYVDIIEEIIKNGMPGVAPAFLDRYM